jgi:putative membrane protein
MRMHGRPLSTNLALALLFAAAAGACKAKEESAAGEAAAKADSTAARADSNRAAVPGTTPATTPAAANGWTSPSILGFALAANDGEVALGKLAEKKATAPAVKAFAREMVTDHQAMLKDVRSLATRLNAVTDTAADNARDLMNHGRDEIKDLTDKAAGADWDNDYIDKAIDDHQKVLDKLQDASKNTADPELRTALEKATGKVQQHLTKAQDIKAKRKS